MEEKKTDFYVGTKTNCENTFRLQSAVTLLILFMYYKISFVYAYYRVYLSQFYCKDEIVISHDKTTCGSFKFIHPDHVYVIMYSYACGSEVRSCLQWRNAVFALGATHDNFILLLYWCQFELSQQHETLYFPMTFVHKLLVWFSRIMHHETFFFINGGNVGDISNTLSLSWFFRV